MVSTPIHRYVIDANRDPSDVSLYPGQNTTSLCPTTTFDGDPIYREGEEPSEDEISERRQQYHAPYHDTLHQQLQRVHQKHGYVVLYDCHAFQMELAQCNYMQEKAPWDYDDKKAEILRVALRSILQAILEFRV